MDHIVNNLPFEIHLPIPGQGENVPGGSFNNTGKMSFAGPGTKVYKRLAEGYRGTCELDEAAKEHDIAYSMYHDRESRNASDRILAERAQTIASNAKKPLFERAWATVVNRFFREGGMSSKLQGGRGMTLRSRAKPVETTPTKHVTPKPPEPIYDDTEKQMRKIADELHKPIRRNFERRKYIVDCIDHVWGVDLADMRNLSKENNGFKWILVIIDAFSKYGWAVSMKDKAAKTVFDSFTSVIQKSNRQPQKIHCDKGSEFYNKLFDKFLADNKIIRYSTYSEFHNPIVERFVKTIKTWIWKEFTARDTKRWVDILPGLIKRYNNKVHSTIKMTPVAASKKKNETQIRKFAFGEKPRKKKHKPKYKVGDIVRISRWKGTFEKGFAPNWSTEIFMVRTVFPTIPPMFQLEDMGGEEIEGSFYHEELQHAKNL